MAESRSVAISVALIGAVATIVAAWLTTRGTDGGSSRGPADPPVVGLGSASIFLSRDGGPGGTTVNVSGEGFAPEERIEIKFHTEQIATTTTNAEGKFSNVAAVVPTSFSVFAPKQFDIVARGESSFLSADAPFMLSG